MRGHLRQRSKGSWEIAIDIGKDPATGRRQQHFETVRGNKGRAQKRMTELLRQLDTDMFIKPNKTTVRDYLEKWLRDYVKPNLSPRTYEGYEYIIRYHLVPTLGSLPLIQLRPEHLQHYYSEKLSTIKANGKGNISARSVRHQHMVLHRALACANQWGLLSRNPADAVTPPKARRPEIQVWNENDIKTFLEAARTTPYFTVFYLALFTGMRRSELLALRWSDVDLLLGQIFVSHSVHQLRDSSYVFREPKTPKSRRTIALSPSTIQAIRVHHDNQAMDRAFANIPVTDEDLVFSTYGGKPLRPNTISRAWKILAARCGLKVIRLHDARHTHASILLKQGIHPKVVQERLGHSTIAVTLDTYSHVAPGLQEAVAKRFDDILGVGYNERVTKSS